MTGNNQINYNNIHPQHVTSAIISNNNNTNNNSNNNNNNNNDNDNNNNNNINNGNSSNDSNSNNNYNIGNIDIANSDNSTTLTTVIVEDLLLFSNLVYLDVSYNFLRYIIYISILYRLLGINNSLDLVILRCCQHLWSYVSPIIILVNLMLHPLALGIFRYFLLPIITIIWHWLTLLLFFFKRLDLSHNNLNELALAKLGMLFQHKLKYLNLSHNGLSTLPKEICYLRQLTHLIVDNNNLGNTQLSLLGFIPK